MAGFLAELNRRNVTRVAVAYAVASWLLIEVASVVLPTFRAPDWVLQVLIVLLVLGFPLALVFAWVYELTPEGLKRESEVDHGRSITGHTAKKLNVVVIILLVVAIGLFVADRFLPGRAGPPSAGPGSAQAPAGKTVPSIAVLAFDNMSADSANEYFAEGISEEILNLLADVKGLSVASRTSAFAMRDKDLPIPEIARALKVRYVLEGSVRKAGEQVRITAQLIDADTDRHVWSDTYDRALKDIFSIQDEIAAAIGQALKVQLLGETGAVVKAEAIDPKVYSEFLEARYLLRRRNDTDMRAANEKLINVVAAEPGFARGHVLLGEAYILNVFDGALLPRDLAQDYARMHALIAASLNPNLGGIDMILGQLAREHGDLKSALEHLDRAVALEPQEPRPYHWRGIIYDNAGYLDECRADLQRALELDPENPNVHFALAGCLLGSGDYARAKELASRGATLGNPAGYDLVVWAELLGGNVESAKQAARRYIDEMGGDPAIVGGLLRELGRNSGQPSDEGFENDSDALLMVHRYDQFLTLLAQAEWLAPSFGVVWAEPFTDLRQDARFVPALEHFGIPELWHAKGPPPDCRAEGDSYTCGHGGSDGP